MTMLRWMFAFVPVLYLMQDYARKEYVGDTFGTYNALLNCMLLVILFILVMKKNKPNNIIDTLILSTFFIYLYFLCKYTVFTIPFLDYVRLDVQYPINEVPISINLVPFHTIMGHGTLYALIGNVFLLTPLGIYLVLIDSEKYRGIKAALLTGFLTTLSIEIIQVITSVSRALYTEDSVPRGGDIDDILLNVSGYMFGYILSRFFFLPLKKRVEEKIGPTKKAVQTSV